MPYPFQLLTDEDQFALGAFRGFDTRGGLSAAQDAEIHMTGEDLAALPIFDLRPPRTPIRAPLNDEEVGSICQRLAEIAQEDEPTSADGISRDDVDDGRMPVRGSSGAMAASSGLPTPSRYMVLPSLGTLPVVYDTLERRSVEQGRRFQPEAARREAGRLNVACSAVSEPTHRPRLAADVSGCGIVRGWDGHTYLRFIDSSEASLYCEMLGLNVPLFHVNGFENGVFIGSSAPA